MKKFIIISILLIISRTFDAITTYFYTPDLSHECNPLISIFGLGWIHLIVVQVLLIGIAIYLFHFYTFKKVDTVEFNKNTNLKEFVSIFNFNNKNNFYKIFYKLPTNKNALKYSLGYVLTYSLIFIGFIVGTSTTFLITSETYKQIYKNYNVPLLLYLMMMLTIIIISVKFYRNEKKIRQL